MKISWALALAVAPVGAAAQGSGWTRQAPLPTAHHLHTIQALSTSEFWACAEPGVLVHTTDAGAHWQSTQLASNSIWALFFLDAQHGWAAGNGFFHTTNGGQSWIQDSSWGSIYDLHFVDALHGWACGNGGVTYRTSDGGLSWAYQAVGPIDTLSSVFFADALTGWTLSIDGQVYKSTNGGQSWSVQWNASGTYLSTLQFFDALEGWAIGGDHFLHTTDGGLSWTQAPVPAGTWSHGAHFYDRLQGLSVGEFGNITRTLDGGQTWTTIQPIGVGPRLWDVQYASASVAAYCGEAGIVERSGDGGQTWTTMGSGGSGTTHAIDARDAQHAWAANDGGEVLVTSDGGQHWNRRHPPGFDVYGRLSDVSFASLSTGWAVGRHEYFGGGTAQIVGSTDGGQSWTLQHSIPAAYFEAVAALDAQTAIAFGHTPSGGTGVWMRTADGGQSWTNVAPTAALVEDADFVDALTGWAVGGLIHKTSDGGLNWTQQLAAPAVLNGVSFADAQNGWAVGWSSTVLHTTNGGQTWTPQTVNAPTNVFLAVAAVSPSTAWIVGGNGYVGRTTNGGLTWQAQSVPLSGTDALEAACFLDADTGWVAGTGIWHTGPLSPGIDLCQPGEGGVSACPCANPPAFVPGGCDNSAGTGGALLASSGSASLAADTLVFSASRERPNATSVVLQATGFDPAGLVFGQGVRCLTGLTKRLYVKSASGGSISAPQPGDPSVSARSAALGDTILAGSSRWYGVYYRDPIVLGGCLSTSTYNITQTQRLLWSP